MKRRLLVASLAAAIAIPTAAFGGAQEPPVVAVDPLVVKGANRATTMSYVRAVTQLSPSGQVSKRPSRLCPFVAGGGREVNRYVLGRLQQVAAETGLAFQDRKCHPNMLILFSREPEVLLSEARKRGKINYNGVQMPRVDRFKTSTSPVRWLSRTDEIAVYGEAPAGGVGSNIREYRAPGSRIVQPTVSVLYHSLVVIDAKKADGVGVAALADYVSMVTLADIKPDAAPAQSSILNLFSGADRARGLTVSDRAYLHAVYKLRSNIGADQMTALGAAMIDELER